MPIYPIECRFCANLVKPEKPLPGEADCLRCSMGRFDVETPFGTVPQYFAWSGIWRPNKTVAQAQRDCPHFKLHPQVIFVGKKGRAESKQ